MRTSCLDMGSQGGLDRRLAEKGAPVVATLATATVFVDGGRESWMHPLPEKRRGQKSTRPGRQQRVSRRCHTGPAAGRGGSSSRAGSKGPDGNGRRAKRRAPQQISSLGPR